MTDYFDSTVNPTFDLTPDQQLEVDQQNQQVIAAEKAAQEAEELAARQQQLSAQQKAAAEQTAGKADMDAGDIARTAAEAVTAPAIGMLDFGMDVVGLIPGLKAADNWWDENTKYQDKNLQAIRDVASIVGPTIVGGGLISGGLKAATAGVKISNSARIAGRIAAELGVDVGVTAISSHSAKDDNLAQGLNEWLGWDVPWATRDEDSPDVRRAKNIQETAGLTAATSLLGLVLGRSGVIGKAVQRVVPRDEKAAQLVAEMDAIKQMDPVDARDAAREVAVTDEAQRRFLADPAGDNGYDPFINEPAESQARAVQNLEANAIQAKIDTSRIARNIDSNNGRAAPVATEYFQKRFMEAPDGTTRAELLQELSDTLAPGVDAFIGKTKITAEMMEQDINNLTSKIFSMDPVEFTKDLEGLRTTIYGGRKFLGEEGFVTAAEAFKRAFDIYLDPKKMKASAMLTTQAAGNVADSAAAIGLIENVADVTRQQELVLENLRIVNQEVRANQLISGQMLNAKKIAKMKDPLAATDFLRTAQENIEQGIQTSNKKAREAIDVFLKINKENPEYLKPILQLYHSTNGDVDSIYKMNRWVENKLGLLNKAFFDGEPTVPSMIVEGIQSARYNSVLSGLSALRAATGNATLLVAKPISVFAGAAATGDIATLKRSFAVYGGFYENMTRAFRLMGQEWKRAVSNPHVVSRADAKFDAAFDDMDILDNLVEGWNKNGEIGKVAMYNVAKFLKAWNSNNFVRWGTNAMTAIDGFTQSVMASGVARSRAYDEMMSKTKGVFNLDEFNTTQQKLYNEMFDETGLLRDNAAKFASGEISLNLDSELVNGLEGMMKHSPILRAVFMFPRTGVNALQTGWSFNPLSALNMGIGRQRKVLNARTVDEMTEALAEHGMEFSQEAFNALRAEYKGRQALGTGVVMAAGLFAANGNLTGNGSQDAAERKRMEMLGWKPLSIRNPFTGDWISYKGLEPFDTLLALVGDIAYQSTRIDQAVTEDFLRKVMYSITANTSNKTFLSGFQVVADLLSQDEGAWNRFAAGQLDSLLPVAGIRSTLSRVVVPQLKDVENDFMSYMKNRNRFMFSGNDSLMDQMDIYTGEPINFTNPLISAANALNPMFKVNGGTEVWRQWLIDTGWDGLQKIRTNPLTREQLQPKQRQWVNNWIAQNAGLKDQIISLMNDGMSKEKLKQYAKQRGLQNQKDFSIAQMYVHDQLDQMHSEAFRLAWAAYRAENVDQAAQEVLIDARNRDLKRGAINSASSANQEIQQLLALPK